MQNLTRSAFAAASFALMCTALPVSAQETVRVRGTIERVEGPIFVVKNRDGAEVKLTVTGWFVQVPGVYGAPPEVADALTVGGVVSRAIVVLAVVLRPRELVAVQRKVRPGGVLVGAASPHPVADELPAGAAVDQ